MPRAWSCMRAHPSDTCHARSCVRERAAVSQWTFTCPLHGLMNGRRFMCPCWLWCLTTRVAMPGAARRALGLCSDMQLLRDERSSWVHSSACDTRPAASARRSQRSKLHAVPRRLQSATRRKARRRRLVNNGGASSSSSSSSRTRGWSRGCSGNGDAALADDWVARLLRSDACRRSARAHGVRLLRSERARVVVTLGTTEWCAS